MIYVKELAHHKGLFMGATFDGDALLRGIYSFVLPRETTWLGYSMFLWFRKTMVSAWTSEKIHHILCGAGRYQVFQMMRRESQGDPGGQAGQRRNQVPQFWELCLHPGLHGAFWLEPILGGVLCSCTLPLCFLPWQKLRVIWLSQWWTLLLESTFCCHLGGNTKSHLNSCPYACGQEMTKMQVPIEFRAEIKKEQVVQNNSYLRGELSS